MIPSRRPWVSALSTLGLAALIAVAVPRPVHAQNAPGTPIGVPMNAPAPAAEPTDPNDPPGRVGRLSELTGQVWLYQPDSGEWVSAERNRPLTSGDRLATDGGARAEVRIGSTVVRLDGGSEIEVLKLDDRQLSLQLHSGSAAVRLRSREAVREFDLRTAEGRFTVQRAGRYRFDRPDDASHVTVYAGQALYEGPASALTVNASQRAEFWLDGAGAAQYSIVDPERDAFAGWNADRDRTDDRSASARYVSPEMTGVEDLDRHGRWEQSPDYGPLWAPTVVAAGWAPYTAGRWAWVAPWGWTWVDEAPWGFAPFHYGRWVYYGSRWCWAPGTYVRRPVYAPALVAWVGGPRLSVSVSIGGPAMPAVGWVPLAPREVYVPGYRVSPGYVRNVNVTHVTNITNITTIINNPQLAAGQGDYANRKYPHAVTVVPASTLTERRPVGPVVSQMRLAPVVREIVERPHQESAIVAPHAPVMPRRAEGQAPSAGGGRIEAPPPPGRARAAIVERPARLEGRPANAAPVQPAPQAVVPTTPPGATPGGPGATLPSAPARTPTPVVPPQARPAAPVVPAVQAPTPVVPPAQGRAIAAGRAVVPVPPVQTPPAAAPAPNRPPVVERAQPRRQEMPTAQRQAPVVDPAARPAVRQEAVVRPPQAQRPAEPRAAHAPRDPRAEAREERKDERPVKPHNGRAAD